MKSATASSIAWRDPATRTANGWPPNYCRGGALFRSPYYPFNPIVGRRVSPISHSNRISSGHTCSRRRPGRDRQAKPRGRSTSRSPASPLSVPEHKVSQADIAERAKAVFPHLARHGRALCQYRHQRPIFLPGSRLVSRAPWLGGAHRDLPASRAFLARAGDARLGRRRRHQPRGHRRAGGQHYHGPRHSEPRCQADEPA